MGYNDKTEPSFAQRFGDWDSVPRPLVDALGRPRVTDAQGRPMSDAYDKLARPWHVRITEDTLAMMEMKARLREAARRMQPASDIDRTVVARAADARPEDAPASFAQRFGDWERLPQQGADTFYRPRETDAAGRPMSDFYEAFARPARVAGVTEAAERERKAAAERARDSWEFDGPDVAKSGGTGLAKGGIGLAGMGGDAWSLIDSGLAKAGLTEDQRRWAKRAIVSSGLLGPVLSPFLSGPTSKAIQSKVEEHTGEFYKPQTRVGRYTQTAAEFAPGAALPGGWLRNLAKFAVLPGIASEAAGEATAGTKWEPYARGGAALATGLGAAALRWPRPRSAQRGEPPDTAPSASETADVPQAVSPRPETAASKYEKLYDLPNIDQLPIEVQYPKGVPVKPGDPWGRLTHTPQGVKIEPTDRVIGRQFARGPDRGITEEEARMLVEVVTGRPYEVRSMEKMGSHLGRFYVTPDGKGGSKTTVAVREDVQPADLKNVLVHEGAGHGIPHLAGKGRETFGNVPVGVMQAGPPTEAELRELFRMFHILHKGKSPEYFGYTENKDILAELWAEGLRGALTNPNWTKTHAPNVFVAAQDIVNNHPLLSLLFKLNSIAPPVVGGTLAAGALAPERSKAAERWPSEDSASSGGDFAEIFSGRRKRPPL